MTSPAPRMANPRTIADSSDSDSDSDSDGRSKAISGHAGPDASVRAMKTQANHIFLGAIRARVKETIDRALHEETETVAMNTCMEVFSIPPVPLPLVCVTEVIVAIVVDCQKQWQRTCRPTMGAGCWFETIWLRWDRDIVISIGIVPDGLPTDIHVGGIGMLSRCPFDTYRVIRIRGEDIAYSDTGLSGETTLSDALARSNIKEWDILVTVCTSRVLSESGHTGHNTNGTGRSHEDNVSRDPKKTTAKKPRTKKPAPTEETDPSATKKKKRKRKSASSLPRAPEGRDSTRPNEETWLTREGLKLEFENLDLSTFDPMKIVHLKNREMVRLILIGAYDACLGKVDTIRDAVRKMVSIGLDGLPCPEEGDKTSSANIESIWNSVTLVTKKNQNPRWFIIKWAQKERGCAVTRGIRGNALPAASTSNFLLVIDKIITAIITPTKKDLVCLYPTQNA